MYPLSIKQEGVGALASWLRQEQITIYHSAAPLFQHFVQTLTGRETFPHLRLLRLASDTVYCSDVEMYKTHFGPECLLVNGWSSTETSTCCFYFLDKATQLTNGLVPVGYALEDMDIVVLDDQGAPIGTDAVGEIAIRSRYLSPGYWQQPELTQAAFGADADDAEMRVYRTRDVGRLRGDGCLEYLGHEAPACRFAATA